MAGVGTAFIDDFYGMLLLLSIYSKTDEIGFAQSGAHTLGITVTITDGRFSAY